MVNDDALIQRGLGLEAQGRFDEAERQFLLVLRRATGTTAVHAEQSLCELFLRPGNVDLDKARRHALAMLEVADSTGSSSMVGTAERELGLIAARRGDWADALRWCDAALARLGADARRERAFCYALIGVAQRHLDDGVAARSSLETALALSEHLDGHADVLLQLAELDDADDEDERACARARRAVARFEAGAGSLLSDAASLKGQAAGKRVLAHLCYKRGEHARGQGLVREALTLFRCAGEREAADELLAAERGWLESRFFSAV